ncbi:MAG: hypothetical protein ACI4HI_09930 [Lachnospiraceae bacterium]
MKNKEMFAKEIVEMAVKGYEFALNNDKLVACIETNCRNCGFYDIKNACNKKREEWAEQEYLENVEKQFWHRIVKDVRETHGFRSADGEELPEEEEDILLIDYSGNLRMCKMNKLHIRGTSKYKAWARIPGIMEEE